MTPRHALEIAQDRIRALRDAARLDADKSGSRVFCSSRERAKGHNEALAVMTMMLAELPEATR